MAEDIGLGDVKTLAIDDSEHMRSIVVTLLQGLGFSFDNIHTARDAAEGFELFRSQPIDLIIVDYQMPVLDGIDFVRLVRKGADSPNPYVPIVMLTAHADREHVIAARDAGVSEFLRKPVTATSLYERIVAIIERPRLFIRTKSYLGPDRRRHDNDAYRGEERRADKLAQAKPDEAS